MAQVFDKKIMNNNVLPVIGSFLTDLSLEKQEFNLIHLDHIGACRLVLIRPTWTAAVLAALLKKFLMARTSAELET